MAKAGANAGRLNQIADRLLGAKLAGALGAGKEDRVFQSTGKQLDSQKPLKALDQLAVKVLAVLGPVALLTGMLTSAVSGFGPLISAAKMVSTLLSGFLAPIFITLAAVILTAVDVFQGVFISAIKAFAQFIFTGAIKAVDALFMGMMSAASAAISMAKAMIEAGTGIVAFYQLLQGNQRAAFDTVRKGAAAANAMEVAGKAIAGNRDNLRKFLDQFQLGKMADFDKIFKENLQLGLEELRRGAGPQAESSGLIEASRKAQMAALNLSPFEAKQLDIQQKILGALQEGLNLALEPAVQ